MIRFRAQFSLAAQRSHQSAKRSQFLVLARTSPAEVWPWPWPWGQPPRPSRPRERTAAPAARPPSPPPAGLGAGARSRDPPQPGPFRRRPALLRVRASASPLTSCPWGVRGAGGCREPATISWCPSRSAAAQGGDGEQQAEQTPALLPPGDC